MRRLIKLKLSVLMAFMAVSNASYAVEVITSPVSRIYPSAEGRFYFRLKVDQCNSGSDYYYVDGTHEQAKVWTTMILSAATTGKPIRVVVETCTPGHKPMKYLYQDF